MSESVACRRKWTFLSTGAGDGFQTNGIAREYTFYLEALGSSRSTASIHIETARSTEGSTVARWVTLGSTYALSSASVQIVQFTGPFMAVRPYVTDMGSTGAEGSTGTHIVVDLIGN